MVRHLDEDRYGVHWEERSFASFVIWVPPSDNLKGQYLDFLSELGSALAGAACIFPVKITPTLCAVESALTHAQEVVFPQISLCQQYSVKSAKSHD